MRPVIVTIDTEGHKGKDPVDRLIWGKTEYGTYGIDLIMDIFDDAGAKILFFVDFAECFHFGKEKIQKIVEHIISRGHDVGVHIHPDHMSDPERLFLNEYSYDEQKKMLTECTKLYKEIVGRPPKSFRAGKYGADYNTLDILCKLGYKYDFSEFYHQKWCGIDPPLTINAPVRYKSLVEFPVTVFQSVSIGAVKREDKIDAELLSEKEMQYALEQTKKMDMPMVITLFLHSFSLLDWRGHPDTPKPSEECIGRVQDAAKYIKRSECFEFISEADLDDIETVSKEKAMASQVKWTNIFKGVYYTYCRAKKVKNFKARALVWGIRIGLSLLALLVVLLIYMLLF